MRALCWNGVKDIKVESVPDPVLLNPRDAIVRVTLSSTCGSDLHVIDGLIPAMQPGDILGHECVGEVLEVGSGVRQLKPGDRVVVSSAIACGACYFCRHELFSCCDNTNQAIELQQPMLGQPTGGSYGFSHAFGGYAGSHAQFIRVPHADVGCFKIPDGVSYEQALFLSDAVPTGYMGAEMCNIQPGDLVAVYGCGAVGLMAQRSAFLLGAERVFAIDNVPERLQMARDLVGSEVLNFEQGETVLEKIQDLTGGRGADAIIDAVGQQATPRGLQGAYDKVAQTLHLATDMGEALRSALFSCRKGGTVVILGIYELMDKFPLGMIINKSLTVRAALQNGQAYVPRLLDLVQAGKLDSSFLLTHRFSLEDSPHGYEVFRKREDGCVRAVFTP